MEKEIICSGDKCSECGGTNTEVKWEFEYDDGSDEPNTSNNLIRCEFLFCNDCQ